MGIANRLQRHPEQITQLRVFRQALDEVLDLGLHVLPIDGIQVLAAGDISIQHGLHSGDALVVAAMKHRGVTLLASNDADFDRVAGIVRCAPL